MAARAPKPAAPLADDERALRAEAGKIKAQLVIAVLRRALADAKAAAQPTERAA